MGVTPQLSELCRAAIHEAGGDDTAALDGGLAPHADRSRYAGHVAGIDAPQGSGGECVGDADVEGQGGQCGQFADSYRPADCRNQPAQDEADVVAQQFAGSCLGDGEAGTDVGAGVPDADGPDTSDVSIGDQVLALVLDEERHQEVYHIAQEARRGPGGYGGIHSYPRRASRCLGLPFLVQCPRRLKPIPASCISSGVMQRRKGPWGPRRWASKCRSETKRSPHAGHWHTFPVRGVSWIGSPWVVRRG